ncbi:dTMP kinase [Kaistia geumhonensis]|uniref:Thymidylate kinase n=1 Tax=Kaistia geumhonensis TaxID=410839 RepID=A0ABU0M1B3_9HYPH|nr:dTMP kinase [Kaistia geumhonensis]MCX5480031.1 dTMP kinase [Kaistia geumhonensis]MDQ0514741.1 dTMP kinase [Kaistia geumhonensis]
MELAAGQPAAGGGRFITFEGGEGAGKSTQMKRLAASLAGRGIAVVETREPGGTPDAEAIRSFILSGRARPLGGGGEAVLFAAARADHVDRVIRPALERGAFVLCDRFIDSTRAYQGADGVDSALIGSLESLAIGDTRPDLTLILDLPAETGLARAAARRGAGDADRFESETIARHEARRRIFIEIARSEPGRCVVIDATRDVDDVAAEIWQVVSERLLKPTP